MNFTLLGTGTTVPDIHRGPAGFLLEHDGARLLVDGGSGTLQRLARAGVDARDLDGGIYSHRHIDHTGDLVPLLFTLRVGVDKPRGRDYPIFAGAGFQAFLDSLRGVYGHWIQGTNWATPVTELPLDAPGTAALPGGITLRTRPANHSAGALHLRFEAGGKSVVFSGDTGPSPALAELAKGCDVLVCECAEDKPVEWGHLCPEDVRDIVARAQPARVVLTHFYPSVTEARALAVIGEAGVPVERGQDGQVLSL